MFIKAFIEEDMVVQLAKVGRKDVQCEASVPYSKVAFVDYFDPSIKNIKVGSTVEQKSDGEYVFSLPANKNTIAYPSVSPTEFKLLLTSKERIALREAVNTDPGIADLFDLIDDPRTSSIDLNLSSVQEAIDYALNFLESEGVVADVETRKAEILSGKLR